MRHFAPRWILTGGEEQKVEALMTMRFSWGGSTTKFELFTVLLGGCATRRRRRRRDTRGLKFESFSPQFLYRDNIFSTADEITKSPIYSIFNPFLKTFLLFRKIT